MSYIDLEDEDLMNADENELYVEEENLSLDNDENGNARAENAAIDTLPSEDAVKVEPKKRVVRNPQPKLNYDRLRGDRGLLALESSFKDVKFKGKGFEKEDLATVMTRLEQWTHRLFPKFTFDDTLQRLEQLGHKKQISNFIRRIRLDMVDDNDSFAANDLVADKEEAEMDPFDRLTEGNPLGSSTQVDQNTGIQQVVALTNEQRERMIRNRLLAEERRLARMKARQEEQVQESRDELNMPMEPSSIVTPSSHPNLQNGNENFSQFDEQNQLSSQHIVQRSDFGYENESREVENLAED